MHLTYRGKLEDHNPSTVFGWHERVGAFERLTPPWANVEIISREGGIGEGGKVVLKIHRGPCNFRWLLRHCDYVKNRQFCDEQLSGPLGSWKHTHKFEPLGEEGTTLLDEIAIQLPLGRATIDLMAGFIKRELGRLFQFRYRRLFTDLARHAHYEAFPRLTVAITGSSGLVGRNLADFLTTGGHRVIRLVRDRRELGEGKAFWNPGEGEIDLEGLASADAVVNLAGASIADRRWTSARKRLIHDSRIQGTSMLAQAMGSLRDGPKVLISASAVGYYGDCLAECVDESSGQGSGFLAGVCGDWEEASRPAERAGLRVANIRTGVVLSAAGGVLQRMFLPFITGVGGRLGSGKQFLSWVDTDDLVAAIHHILMSDDLDGPINVTAPHPVTNVTFTSDLGSVLERPTVIPIPRLAITTIFGEMGRELLLGGQRVFPEKLTASGFQFFYERLEESLRFQLGRMKD